MEYTEEKDEVYACLSNIALLTKYKLKGKNTFFDIDDDFIEKPGFTFVGKR